MALPGRSLVLTVSKDFCFCLHSSDAKFSTFDYFPCILECNENNQILKISHHKNVNKRKNRLTPVKLESERLGKKIIALREGLGRGVSIERYEEATTTCLSMTSFFSFSFSALFSYFAGHDWLKWERQNCQEDRYKIAIFIDLIFLLFWLWWVYTS